MKTNLGSDEFEHIRAINARLGKPSSRVSVGIGDDVAVVMPTKAKMLLCSDSMVEGIHFSRQYSSAADLGHKSLASCLSDIAATNGRPLYALFSIAMPKDTASKFLDEFYSAAGFLARELKVDIVGGDLSSSPSIIFIDVSCVGESEHPILRSGAKPGDLIAISGTPGASAAGFFALKNLALAKVPASLSRAHLRPQPRFDLLPSLNSMSGLCSALIDVSDGISNELHHIARMSNVGIELDIEKIPLHQDAKTLAQNHGQNALQWALSGGEDYELIATLDSTKVEARGGVPHGFTIIGRVTEARDGVQMIDSSGRKQPLVASGFNHFASS